MSDYKLLCNKFSLTSNGMTINPIGDTGLEPVTLPVLPVLRITISTNLEELPPRAFFRLLAHTPCNQEAFAYVTGVAPPHSSANLAQNPIPNQLHRQH